MGVRKLNKFLTNKNLIISYRNLYDYINKLKKSGSNNAHNGKIVIAIDFWLYAHKFLHSCRSDNILLGFWNQIMKFLSCGIIPLYVMDGSVPVEKQDKINERIKKRNSYKKKIENINNLIENYISDDNDLEEMYKKKEKLQKHTKRIKTCELNNIHDLFNTFGIPYIRAEFEADAMCAKLYKEKIISACLSDDMDMLALGCGSTLKFLEGKIIEFDLDMIKSKLKLNQDKFIELCIMFGCDYMPHHFKYDCDDIYNMILVDDSTIYQLFVNEHKKHNENNENIENDIDHVKEIYLYSSDKEKIPQEFDDIKMIHIEFDDLKNFLFKLNWFDTSSYNLNFIENNINKINCLIDNNVL